MNDELVKTATSVSARLAQLEDERRRIGLEAFAVSERLDPETAMLAENAFDSRQKAADWFTDEVQSLGELTPWQCIAEGNRDRVHNVLSAIEHGTFG